mgnify:CR=1 FL=1
MKTLFRISKNDTITADLYNKNQKLIASLTLTKTPSFKVYRIFVSLTQTNELLGQVNPFSSSVSTIKVG